MPGSTQLHRLIENALYYSSLESLVFGYWTQEEKAQFPAFIESEGLPGMPFPRIVYRINEPSGTVRMSGPSRGTKLEYKEYPIVFEVYSKQSETKTAKTIASEVIEEILKVFGGHPSEGPTLSTSVSNGCVVDIRYLLDVGTRLDDAVYLHYVTYLFKLDTPIKALP